MGTVTKLEVSLTPPDNWDDLIASASGTVFHTAAWAEHISAERSNTQAWFTTVRSAGGAAQSVALAFFSRSKTPLLRLGSGRVLLESAPFGLPNSGEGCAERHLQQLELYSRRMGAVDLHVGSYANPNQHRLLEGLSFEMIRRMEFELDLSRGEDQLWMSFAHKRRKNVKKAQRLGVEIHDIPGRDGLLALRKLQAESAMSIRSRGGPQLSSRFVPTGDDSRRFLLDRGVADVVGATVEGELVSASLFTTFNGLVYHTFSGHSQRATRVQAPTLLLWEMMKKYKSEGAIRFNLGGCGADAVNPEVQEHGVFRYKRDFGGDCLDCASGLKVLRPLIHRFRAMVRRLRS